MIKIHQIQLTDEMIDMINEKGHDAVPANKARMDGMFGKFKSENFQYYTEAYNVYTDSLEKAFEITNLWNNQELVDVIGDFGTSSSVGDIFEKDGKFFICAMFGFEEIEVAA